MDTKDLLYIEDRNKKKLFYRFTPAFIASAFVPLIIILDDEGSHFEYKMWNVLTPIIDKDVSWMGENKDLLQTLISEIVEEHECEEHIYLYGSGRGAYRAILHGILCKANAVYMQDPKIKQEGIDFEEKDLTSFLNPIDSFPIFYLCENEDIQKDEIDYFTDACEQNNIKYHTKRCVRSEKNESAKIKEVLNMLEKMISQT